MATSTGWFYWAILSAVFAALTAIFAKIGIQGVDSDLATLIRTAIIMVVLLQYLSPLGWEHINLTGDYLWRSSAKVGAGKFRSLRPLPPA